MSDTFDSRNSARGRKEFEQGQSGTPIVVERSATSEQDGSHMPDEYSEQRRYRRHPAHLRCCVTHEQVRRFTRMADISLGGARIHTIRPPKVGEVLDVVFALGDNGPKVRADAVVVWRSDGIRGRGGVIGVSFSTLSAPKELEAYMDTLVAS